MSAPRITRDDLGKIFQHSDGSVWRCVWFTAEPMAALERLRGTDGATFIGDGDQLIAVVGAPIFDGFERLVPEDSHAR